MEPEIPIRVVGCFGQQSDFSFVKRIVPWYSESTTDIDALDGKKNSLQTDPTGRQSGTQEGFDENDDKEADRANEWPLGLAPQGKRVS